MISSLSGTPAAHIRYISVSFNAVAINPYDDYYFTNFVQDQNGAIPDNTSINGYVTDLDWSHYSQVVFEWYVEYTDNTYEDYWIQYDL
ncbi:hypothetical protein GCM10028826_06730 [Mucilaginibacter boryungensis]